MFDYGNMIRYDPTPVDLTSNYFVLCTNVKVIYIRPNKKNPVFRVDPT